MDIQSLIIWLVIGAVAGWLAGVVVTGFGLGLIGNIVVGIIGSFIAGWLLLRSGLSRLSKMRSSIRSSSLLLGL